MTRPDDKELVIVATTILAMAALIVSGDLELSKMVCSGLLGMAVGRTANG